MTEYWVSQGNKWCDLCKIFISNNPATIRNHEIGTRHKENVAKRLNDMRASMADKAKEEKAAAKALEQIEAKAKRSYQKDIATQEGKKPQAPEDNGGGTTAWEYDSSSGYYYDQHTGIHYDPKSGFYYSDVLGKWVTQEEAFAATQNSSGGKKEPLKRPAVASATAQPSEKKDAMQSGPAPGRVIKEAVNPTRSAKGAAPSKFAVGKRKNSMKPKVVSAEEEAALKAREAARKRVKERDEGLLGLYGH